MSFSDAQLDEIRSRADLVAIIGRDLELKKASGGFVGLCPFHQEKTASFHVSPQRGTYKCFGCNESGDVFAYVMAAKGQSFPDAVRSVAAEVGVEVEASRAGGAGGSTRGGRSRRAPRPAGGGGGGGSGRDAREEPGREPPRSSSSAEVRQIGDAKGAKVVQTYDYRTRKGRLIYQVVRMEPKSFRQRRPWPGREADWVWSMKAHPKSGLGEQDTWLYRFQELTQALVAEDPIFIAEGEKDVEALMGAEQVATCNSGGAGKWRDDLAEPFRGFRGHVRIVQDRDEPGEAHALEVFDSLSGVLDPAATLWIMEPAVGKDAADHLGAGRSVEDLVQVWPLPENLRHSDPQRFKRIMLRKALESAGTVLDHTQGGQAAIPDQPLFESGLVDLVRPVQWQGCVVLSGEPSTGKSYLAISTAIDAALAGWDVFYLACEMGGAFVQDRAARALASAGVPAFQYVDPQRRYEIAEAASAAILPDRFHLVEVGIGVTVQDVIEFLAEHVTERPTLTVVDSVSSFVDNMGGDPSDSFGMANLVEVTRWITGVSKLSHGQLAFLLLSELNKEGRAKGRFLDHRCNFALRMTLSDEDERDQVKTIRTTKSWHGPVGKLGEFVLWWQTGRLVRISD